MTDIESSPIPELNLEGDCWTIPAIYNGQGSAGLRQALGTALCLFLIYQAYASGAVGINLFIGLEIFIVLASAFRWCLLQTHTEIDFAAGVLRQCYAHHPMQKQIEIPLGQFKTVLSLLHSSSRGPTGITVELSVLGQAVCLTWIDYAGGGGLPVEQAKLLREKLAGALGLRDMGLIG